ncbi:MAG: hypothetical protein AAFQ83_04985 [Bacteroidota bacterium]
MRASILALIGCILCLGISCKRCDDPSDPDCPNYDPCFEVSPISADFDIMAQLRYYDSERNGFGDTLVSRDTMRVGTRVKFVAPEGYDTYEWKVGKDPRTFDEPTVSLLFTEPEGRVRVQLIVTSERQTNCLSPTERRDTLEKSFTIVPFQTAPIFGRYRGVLDSAPADSFDVSLTLGAFDLLFDNINRGCKAESRLVVDYQYDVMSFGADDLFAFGCDDPNGFMYLDSSRQFVTIPFTTRSIDNLDAPRQSDCFRGVKIQ